MALLTKNRKDPRCPTIVTASKCWDVMKYKEESEQRIVQGDVCDYLRDARDGVSHALDRRYVWSHRRKRSQDCKGSPFLYFSVVVYTVSVGFIKRSFFLFWKWSKTDLMQMLWGLAPLKVTYLAELLLVDYSCSLKSEGILNSMGGRSVLKL